jgi:cell division protein FtsB
MTPEQELLFDEIHDAVHAMGMTEEEELYSAIREELTALRADIEHERLRLAACGVAAMSNTQETAANRLTPDHPCYSASYADVCRAVDREMALRARVALLEKENKILEKIARDTLGTLFAERYIRETRAALDAAKEEGDA